MIQEDLPREDSASALDWRNNHPRTSIPCTWLFKLRKVQAGWSVILPAALTRDSPTVRQCRLCWPSHGCHCLQPVISSYRPQILMLEHENSSFAAGGPAVVARPGSSDPSRPRPSGPTVRVWVGRVVTLRRRSLRLFCHSAGG